MKVTLASLLIIGTVVGFSKKNTISDTLPPTYYYFPKANIYYNATEHNYFVKEAGNNWQLKNALPDSLISLLDKKVLLKNVPDPVWKNNEQDKLIYAVELYASPSDLKEIKTAKSNSASGKKLNKQKSIPDKKQESGFKRFFKKLFGK